VIVGVRSSEQMSESGHSRHFSRPPTTYDPPRTKSDRPAMSQTCRFLLEKSAVTRN
jgi:hypothetical protein